MKFKLVEEVNNNFSDTLYKLYGKRFIPLTESNLHRIAQGHDDTGYAVISASKKENRYIDDTLEKLKGNPDSLNNLLTKQLRDIIYHKGYTYVPVFGGYREKNGTVLEKSFIIYPYKRNNTLVPWNDFVEDVYDIANSTDENGKYLFNQDSILIKRPNEASQYIDPRTRESVFDLGTTIDYNDEDNEYFTALKKWKDLSLNRKNSKWDKGKPQRFSITEWLLAPSPSGMMDSHARHLSGELF